MKISELFNETYMKGIRCEKESLKREEAAKIDHDYDYGGMQKMAVAELCNCKVIKLVVSNWVSREGKPFLASMKHELNGHEVMVEAKSICKLDLAYRPSIEHKFWLRFNHAKPSTLLLGEGFSMLMQCYLDSNDIVHWSLTEYELKEIHAAIQDGKDAFGLDKTSQPWFLFMVWNMLSFDRFGPKKSFYPN